MNRKKYHKWAKAPYTLRVATAGLIAVNSLDGNYGRAIVENASGIVFNYFPRRGDGDHVKLPRYIARGGRKSRSYPDVVTCFRSKQSSSYPGAGVMGSLIIPSMYAFDDANFSGIVSMLRPPILGLVVQSPDAYEHSPEDLIIQVCDQAAQLNFSVEGAIVEVVGHVETLTIDHLYALNDLLYAAGALSVFVPLNLVTLAYIREMGLDADQLMEAHAHFRCMLSEVLPAYDRRMMLNLCMH